jgi:hypothetical protein
MATVFPKPLQLLRLHGPRCELAVVQFSTPFHFARWPIRKSLTAIFTLWYKVTMKTINRTIAIIELLLVFPAALFMTALFLREVQPLTQAGRLVDWFSQHVVLGLYVFLIVMPLAAFVIGCAIVLRGWRKDVEFRQAALGIFTVARAHVASLLIAGVTLMAGGILAIVAMHMITE